MARRRRRKTGRNVFIGLCLAGTVAALWWTSWKDDVPGKTVRSIALGPAPVLTTERPEGTRYIRSQPGILEKGATLRKAEKSDSALSQKERVESLIAAGDQALARTDPVAARTHFSEAVTLGVDDAELLRVRAELVRIGNETIFSPSILEHDPLVERYIVQPGDALAKIAVANKVSADLLAQINGIPNKNLIRAGQTIKIVKGPFRAAVDRATYSLDLYLGSTFVQHYRVGLGADGSTPAGEWRVKSKLKNPTYYPPRGGRIVAADDPENPLGERWIGLEGIGGEALGQQRYGLHGTIEPESIGQNSSLGCIRMFNEDVEMLFSCLVTKHSTILVR